MGHEFEALAGRIQEAALAVNKPWVQAFWSFFRVFVFRAFVIRIHTKSKRG
jgi:hypothetical protein